MYQNSHGDILEGITTLSDDGAWSGPDPGADMGSEFEGADLAGSGSFFFSVIMNAMKIIRAGPA